LQSAEPKSFQTSEIKPFALSGGLLSDVSLNPAPVAEVPLPLSAVKVKVMAGTESESENEDESALKLTREINTRVHMKSSQIMRRFSRSPLRVQVMEHSMDQSSCIASPVKARQR
jgi:hypothetical protein